MKTGRIFSLALISIFLPGAESEVIAMNKTWQVSVKGG